MLSASITKDTTVIVVLNGREVDLAENATLADVVEIFATDASSVAVALNGGVVQREQLPITIVKSRDVVHLIRAISGG